MWPPGYPIYILQGPIFRIGEEILKRFHFGSMGFWLFTAAEVCTVLSIAHAAIKLFDNPLQKYFKRWAAVRVEGMPPVISEVI